LAVVLSLVCGGSAAVGVNSYVKNAGPAPNTTQVVVAAVDLPRGTTLTADHVKLRGVPRDQIHARAVTKLDDALSRAVLTPLIKDESLLEDKLAPKGSRGSMSWTTKPGMRAFTIQTPNVASGVAGFVMPGDRVDVLLTMGGDDKDGTGGGSTVTLLQNIDVLAVDQTIEAPAENRVDANKLRSVTLQVTPDEALKLDLGQNRGILHLSLRHPDDKSDAHTRVATLSELRFKQQPPKEVEPAPAPAPPPAPVVEAPKSPAARPIYVYHPALHRIVEHQNDGTLVRKVISPGSTMMGTPWPDDSYPPPTQEPQFR
jgi:pilus assembly protein CpaB